MKICLFLGALLTLTPFLRAQKSSFPDLSDFTKSPTEHFIDQVDEPFRVRSVIGVITTSADGDVPGRAGVLFEIEGPGQERTIRHGQTDSHGHFKISRVPEGTYRFKTTLNGFSSVIGTIVVSRNAARSSKIVIKMPLGM